MKFFVSCYLFVFSISVYSLPTENDVNSVKYDYQNCPTGEKDKLNVHLVCHTHNDVGWLKTVDQYYYGANQTIHRAGVQYIIDSVIESLLQDSQKKFIYVETAFFARWWKEQPDSVQHAVKRLVCNGQLEFIGGGWSMNDEAASHYNSIIDQMSYGLRILNDTFGKCGVPKVAWQIDPFGHSKEQASLFSQMYFDGLFLGRIDYQDKNFRKLTKTMEHIWSPSINLGDRVNLFTGALPNFYNPPDGFCFDILCSDAPIMDDPTLKNYNVEERIKEFIDIAENQVNYFATNHIIMTMGSDFSYQNAAVWYKNLDKLIKHVNEKQTIGSRVNVFYSTPSCYLHALNQANISWSVKTDDFFPYASDPHAYWTGYFTSRPALKRYERIGNNELQICKQLAARTEIEEVTLHFLREAMGVLQHHDAITGTAKQHVTNDYEESLAVAIETCHDVVKEAYDKIMPMEESLHTLDQYFCNQLNISQCNISEDSSSFAVTIYNPLGWNLTKFVHIPVTGLAYEILDYNGKSIAAQIVPIPPFIAKIPGRKSNAASELFFEVQLPPLGYATYLVRKSTSISLIKEQVSSIQYEADGDWIIKNKFITVYVDGKTGLLKQLQLADNSKLAVDQSFYWYRGMNGNNSNYHLRASGAYIFRPNGTDPITLGNNVIVTLVKGSLVQEIRQTFTPWISQIIRLYKNSEHVELKWVVGPIPVQDRVGKEIITRFDTNLGSNDLFYTDSNGREMVERKRNYRPTWKLHVTEPVSGNYYPVNSRIYIRDEKSRMQFTVLNDRSQGGSSMKNGSVELMVHRRLLHDDYFGVDEALNEPGVDGKGLVITGSHYLIFSDISSSASKHRPLAQALYMRPHMSFTPHNLPDASYMKSYKMFSSGLKTPLPPNVHLLTLEPWKAGTILMRFEHIYEFDEDSILSKPAVIPIQDLFADFNVMNLEETTLSANQYLSDAKKLCWNIEGSKEVCGENNHIIRNSPEEALKVDLTAMQIRTFKAKIAY